MYTVKSRNHTTTNLCQINSKDLNNERSWLDYRYLLLQFYCLLIMVSLLELHKEDCKLFVSYINFISHVMAYISFYWCSEFILCDRAAATMRRMTKDKDNELCIFHSDSFFLFLSLSRLKSNTFLTLKYGYQHKSKSSN